MNRECNSKVKLQEEIQGMEGGANSPLYLEGEASGTFTRNHYEYKEEKNRRINILLFMIVLVIAGGAIYIYNVLTPVMSDDLMFDASLYHNFGDIIKAEYEQYMNWTGRSVLQILLKISSIMPLGLFRIINSIVFIILGLLIYENVKGKEKWDWKLFLLIQLCLWNFSVDFSQTVLWLSGACNYLWGAVIIISYLTLFRKLLKEEINTMPKLVYYLLLPLLGFLAGWGNENTSGGAILITLLMAGWYFYNNRCVKPWMATSIAASCGGFLFLLMAPGNKVRGEMVKAQETYQGLEAYISRGLKVIKSIDEYLLLYIVVICILGAYFYYSKRKWQNYVEVFIFGIGAVATASVLIFTPEPMGRAYYGANIYMMIAALLMVQQLPEKNVMVLSLKTGGIIAGTIAFMFIYIEEGANLVRILREVNIREEYILEEIGKGESDLTLPALRPEFASKYSMAHLADISEDKSNWNNDLYRNVYRIDQLKVLPWDEWEAMLED